MDLRTAMKQQYHAGLAMLADCVRKCPEDMWLAGEEPRTYWRIVFHAAFFTQLYMGQSTDSFQRWPGARNDLLELWSNPAYLEPYELPLETPPVGQKEMLDYIEFIDSLVDPTVDGLDLDTDDSGFAWYAGTSKLSHELMNLRHIQGHVGQLSELLMLRNIDIDWVSKAASCAPKQSP